MATITTVTWKSKGNVMQTGIQAQIDADNLDEKNFDAGAAPYDQFRIYLSWASSYPIKRGDQLVDEANGVDTYTISNKPESFPNGHVEISAQMPVGS